MRKTGRLPSRPGLTLLEVMLALVILGGAVRRHRRIDPHRIPQRRDARDATNAQVVADSLMSEIAAGIVPALTTDRQPDPYDPEFVYSVAVEQPNQDGLLLITVTVERADSLTSGQRTQSFRLVRWMLDPNVDLAPPPTDEVAQ